MSFMTVQIPEAQNLNMNDDISQSSAVNTDMNELSGTLTSACLRWPVRSWRSGGPHHTLVRAFCAALVVPALVACVLSFDAHTVFVLLLCVMFRFWR